MPFRSQAQRRFMFSQHPEIAKRWAEHTPRNAELPEKINNERDKKMSGQIQKVASVLAHLPLPQQQFLAISMYSSVQSSPLSKEAATNPNVKKGMVLLKYASTSEFKAQPVMVKAAIWGLVARALPYVLRAGSSLVGGTGRMLGAGGRALTALGKGPRGGVAGTLRGAANYIGTGMRRVGAGLGRTGSNIGGGAFARKSNQASQYARAGNRKMSYGDLAGILGGQLDDIPAPPGVTGSRVSNALLGGGIGGAIGLSDSSEPKTASVNRKLARYLASPRLA